MKESKRCAACFRVVQLDKYCSHHHQAFLNLKKKYNLWVRAYGQISWQEYLKKLQDMHETGLWVKEVIALESRIGHN
jgi:hypothetical protein